MKGTQQRKTDRSEKESEYDSKVISTKRVSKTTSGGRTMSFQAVVAIGDRKGSLGLGKGKANEVPEAIRKATDSAKKHLVRLQLKSTPTGLGIHHEAFQKTCGAKLLMRPAKAGKGVKAGSSVRVIFELAGITDVVAKSLGSNQPYNLAQAAFTALKNQRNVSDFLSKKSSGGLND